jgi:putative transcriptional regulator
MIRVLLKKILDDRIFETKEKITLNQVAIETGISRATLNRIANNPGYNCNTDTIDKLCKFFECTPCELMEFIPDEKKE